MTKKLSISLPKFVKTAFQPTDYVLREALKNAVEVSIALGQPLLLTGEPGTGKTKLAYKIAHDLAQSNNFHATPLIFNTKTTSNARDLFYTYDALSHFQAANIKQQEATKLAKTADFIELQALGKAIAQTNPTQVDQRKFSTPLDAQAKGSVVLIDEIDKAPRDFTNDILNEIENYHFSIKEQDNYKITKGKEQPIVIIMTSNSEKNLPDAFLRRCIFYHIPFEIDDLLVEIVQQQLGKSTAFTKEALEKLVEQFATIREHSVRKPPATAELIAWLRILEIQQYMDKPAAAQQALALQNLSVLIKTKEDLEAVQAAFGIT